MPTRPRLRTTHQPIPRGDGALQLGTGETALTLTGLPAALADCLHQLDGTIPLAHLEEACAEAGVPASALHDVLRILREARVLEEVDDARRRVHRSVADRSREEVDALVAHGLTDTVARSRLARTGRARVAVQGRGALAVELATALDDVVGTVETTEHGSPTAAELVVIVARDAVDPAVAGRLVVEGRHVLPVVTTGGGVVIGPWHGRPDDPCPTCLDLRRAAADDAWPLMLRRITAPRADGREALATADPLVSRTAGAVVAQWVRRRVVGLPEAPGLTCELDPWQLGMLHRVWPVHPACTGHRAGDPGRAPRTSNRMHARPPATMGA